MNNFPAVTILHRPKNIRWMIFIGFVALLQAFTVSGCSNIKPYYGTELSSRDLAPLFNLHNQFGQPVSLSDYHGEIVLLSFIYTKCTDICPIVTKKFRDVHSLLGKDIQSTALIIITVDPEHDTINSIYDYSKQWEMLNKWQFLTGTRENLSSIWKAYYIDPVTDNKGSDRNTSGKQIQENGTEGFYQEINRVTHSSPLYVIDESGVMRIMFTLPFEAADVVHDIKLLLN